VADDMISVSRAEFGALEERAKKLAMEKSYLQLLVRLMSKVSAVTDLEGTVEGIINQVPDVIGGTNVILYYLCENQIHCRDLLGRRQVVTGLGSIEDDEVRGVFQTGKPLERTHNFADTLMQTPAFTDAFTWVYPLPISEKPVGVLKMEGLHLGMRPLYDHLPVFFSARRLAAQKRPCRPQPTAGGLRPACRRQ